MTHSSSSSGPIPPSVDVDIEMPFFSSQDLVTANPYSEDDHRRMDRAVSEFLAKYGPEWHLKPSSWELFGVLRVVILGDDLLDRSYSEPGAALQLLGRHPWLGPKLADAWQSGSYHSIRNLAVLQAPTAISESTSETRLDALKKGLSASYRGSAVDAFYLYLEQNNKTFRAENNEYYGKFCSIVQSSGTGKTRLILELSKRGVCVIYMNIRSPEDHQGYPHRDNIPANILTNHCATEYEYRIRCFTFFAAFFKLLGVSQSNNPLWYGDLMCDVENQARIQFFESLQNTYANLCGEIRASEKLNGEKKVVNEEEVVKKARKLMIKYYDNLVFALGKVPLSKQDSPRVVIAFDEAHVLHGNSEPFRRATVLFRTIKEYSTEDEGAPIWVVFASTTSKVTHFASPQALFPSARVAVEGQLLFPPFTQLGWDQHAPPLEAIRPDEVANRNHILSYGRPLWISLKDYRPEKLFRLARQKLCGEKEFRPDNSHQAFAVLGQRFGLDITFGHRHAVEFVETSVASHLRVCIKTTEDRIWSYTTYPSEPILSCAAAYLLHVEGLSSGTDKLDPSLCSLQCMVNDGVVDTGKIGELVSRFIWLLAKDFLVRWKGLDPMLEACQPISVVEYLQFVFGPRIWQAAPQAPQIFQDAYINFSHWISMGFNINPLKTGSQELFIDDWTLCHWGRTSAVQCCHNQPLINKVIPMFFKPSKNSDNKTIMSQILISDKATSRQNRAYTEDIQRDHQHIAPGYQGLPYIAILVDLGVGKSEFSAEMDFTKDGNHCLRIYASQLDATTYPFLHGHENITRILQDLYRRQFPTSTTSLALQRLEDQVQFGLSNEPRHMNVKNQVGL
ncbi:hypothetical protein HD554DRAFT_2083867 [Boletus coccyginus]|nr:hypothetical protein HD554DRAFT_2083867 [Boletus coccyginus]